MLKRLEMVGFKSFADKTVFEFGPGITAIVGPNGSGKSNIVDGVRWILGEQSAKSLRGGEMTDVIFNGSASRRSFGMAEVSLILDNSRGLLATDSAEVQITRRVYRSGEGEYLINQHPCRLKDIKDIFLGSGAGSDAYCIIAQGKVDTLLQASTKERRTIFEEAAGISRFKAKKIETLRKLDRVDLNVQRLRDIIDEVEKQLRSVKLQASKAQRYQEYSTRLKEIRLGLGLHEYHQHSLALEIEEQAVANLRQDLDQQGAQVATWEAQQHLLEQQLSRLEEELHHQEAALGEARQHIKATETTLGHERNHWEELETELNRTRQQKNELTSYLSSLQSSCRQAYREFETVQTQSAEQHQRVTVLEEGLQAIVERLKQLQQQLQEDKADHLEQMRLSARLQNDATTFKGQYDNLSRELNRVRQKTEQAAETLASLDLEMQELTEAESNLQDRLNQAKEQLANEKAEGERLRTFRDETNELILDLRQQRSGLVSRAEVLEGLEKSHEGLGSGVGEVLDMLGPERENGENSNPWRQCIIGMVADFLSVQREYAPLVDLALGDWAQRFLVRDTDLLANLLAEMESPFSSRVSFLPLDEPSESPRSGNESRRRNRLIEVSQLGQVRMPLSPEGSPAHQGVVARADQLVTCEHEELQDLPAQLLARTLIVRDLPTAWEIADHTTGYRFISLQGELLEPDGTVTVGSYHADTGILSRKSELREVREEITRLDRRVVETERDLSNLREQIAISNSRTQQHQQEIQVLSEQVADLRSRLDMHRNRREGLHEEVVISKEEINQLEQQRTELQESWERAQEQAAGAEQQVQSLQARIEETELEIRQREQHRQQRHQEWTSGKVGLATIEERLSSLQEKYQQLQQDFEQRRSELQDSEDQLISSQQRQRQSQLIMLHASATLAGLYVKKEECERMIAELVAGRDAARLERTQLNEQTQDVRGKWQAQQEQFHTHELQANNIRHKRDTLANRLREDYQVELKEIYQQALENGLWSEPVEVVDEEEEVEIVEAEVIETEEDQPDLIPVPWKLPTDIEAANEEIDELRKKLSRLGSVNMDSLEELASLETRAATLEAQYEDLTSAKRSLEDIINKINNDSRRLFTETYEAVRGHFQELFRKLFGGGMADIVLEDESDVLESGIEIVARPPGKELRSISLMSGGEKTLTAVALLLAIFRSHPSPFCILDEVDAALDEANIGRFADVLREFLDQSHFIIITHAKRTMSTADVIYGITMQESGISKRVSVRFDDWPTDANPEEGIPVEASKNGD